MLSYDGPALLTLLLAPGRHWACCVHSCPLPSLLIHTHPSLPPPTVSTNRDRDEPRHYDDAGAPAADYRAMPRSTDQAWRQGDWECPGCRFHNFASRDRCFRCGEGQQWA